MSRLSAREIESVRQFAAPGLADAPSEYLEQIVWDSLSSLPGEMSEDFLKTLGSVASAAAPVLQKAAPSVLQGVTQGAAAGGPWGAVIGAGAGLASGLLQQTKGPASATMPRAPTASSQTVATATPSIDMRSTRPADLPTGQAAAATALGLMQNPTVRQVLSSQVLGENGRSTVQAPSGAVLPRAAINQLLAYLLSNAAEGLPESDSIDDQSYLMNELGEYLVDPASPEHQAAMVLAHLSSGREANQSRDVPSNEESVAYWAESDWLAEVLGGDTDAMDEIAVDAVEFY